MNQRDRAMNALYRSNLDLLRDIVGEAQNQPPLGCADGSIPEELWYILRDAEKAGREFKRLFNLANDGAIKRRW